jgi:hypothetical protein
VRYPVVNEEGDVRVLDEIEGFLRGWVGGHYYCGGRGVGR